MNEILIVPDVHGRRFWEPALNYPGQIIFLGDYFDSKDSTTETEAFSTLCRILSFKQKNPDRVTLLIGNHDLHYFDPAFACEGFSTHYYSLIDELLKDSQTRNSLQLCKQEGSYLFSHAGVTHWWYDKHKAELSKRGTTLEDQINTYFQDNKKAFDEAGPIRGGKFPFGSPIWADLSEIFYEPESFIPDIFQIVGHSHVPEGEEPYINTHIACLDNKRLYLLKDNVIVPYL